jgi:hypothetical protein
LPEDLAGGFGRRLHSDIDIAARDETRADADGKPQIAPQIRTELNPAQPRIDETLDQRRVHQSIRGQIGHRQDLDRLGRGRRIGGIGGQALDPGGSVLQRIIKRHATSQHRHLGVAHQQHGHADAGQCMADRRGDVVCTEHQDRLRPEAARRWPSVVHALAPCRDAPSYRPPLRQMAAGSRDWY